MIKICAQYHTTAANKRKDVSLVSKHIEMKYTHTAVAQTVVSICLCILSASMRFAL